jgi:hypothetical protein
MNSDRIQQVAKDILEDLNGAKYYNDEKLLSGYLKTELNISDAKANLIAKEINEDRIGAHYYQDKELLVNHLMAYVE